MFSLIHDFHGYDIDQDSFEVDGFVLVEVGEEGFDEKVEILLHENGISEQVEQAFVEVKGGGVVLWEWGLGRGGHLVVEGQ